MSIMIIRYLFNDTIECSPGESKKPVCIRPVVIIQVLDKFCDLLNCLVKGKAIFEVTSEDIEGPTTWGQLPNGRVEMRLNKLECHFESWKRQGGVMKKRLIARKKRVLIQQAKMTEIPTQRVVRMEKTNGLDREAKTIDRICA